MSRIVARTPTERTGRPTTALPAPSLDLDFCLAGGLPPGAIRFSRGSPKRIWDNGGVLRTVPTDLYHSDHDPLTGAPRGLLIEEARTNLATRSEEFGSSPWGGTGQTVTADDIAAPDGATTADKVTWDTAVDTRRQDVTVADDSAVYTGSIFVKQVDYTHARLQVALLSGSPAVDHYAVLEFSTGTVTKIGSPIAVGAEQFPNGWWRLWATTANNASGNVGMRISAFPSNGGPIQTGSLYLWGAQAELGAFPTSYIKTTAASATRAADSVDTTDLAWLDQSQGTILAEFEMAYVDSGERFLYVIDDGSANNMIRASRSNGKFRPTVFSGGSQVVDMSNSGAWAADTVYRGALAYRANDYRAGLDGTLQEADTSGATPTGLTTLRLGTGQGGAPINYAGWLRRLRYWPVRLADDLIKELTA